MPLVRNKPLADCVDFEASIRHYQDLSTFHEKLKFFTVFFFCYLYLLSVKFCLSRRSPDRTTNDRGIRYGPQTK